MVYFWSETLVWFWSEINRLAIPHWKIKLGCRRTPPYAFTEQGVAMLSGILHSERAIRVNIQIMRIFTRMREMLEANKEILKKLDDLERKGIEHDNKILLIFEFLKQLEQAKQEELDHRGRK